AKAPEGVFERGFALAFGLFLEFGDAALEFASPFLHVLELVFEAFALELGAGEGARVLTGAVTAGEVEVEVPVVGEGAQRVEVGACFGGDLLRLRGGGDAALNFSLRCGAFGEAEQRAGD